MVAMLRRRRPLLKSGQTDLFSQKDTRRNLVSRHADTTRTTMPSLDVILLLVISLLTSTTKSSAFSIPKSSLSSRSNPLIEAHHASSALQYDKNQCAISTGRHRYYQQKGTIKSKYSTRLLGTSSNDGDDDTDNEADNDGDTTRRNNLSGPFDAALQSQIELQQQQIDQLLSMMKAQQAQPTPTKIDDDDVDEVQPPPPKRQKNSRSFTFRS